MKLFGRRRGPRTETTEVDLTVPIDKATEALFEALGRSGAIPSFPWAELTTEGQRSLRAVAAAAVRAAAPVIIEDTTRATCAVMGVKLHSVSTRHAVKGEGK